MVILNLVYVSGMLVMLMSFALFLYGRANGNIVYMDRAALWGLIGAGVTVIFGLIRRVRLQIRSKAQGNNEKGGH